MASGDTLVTLVPTDNETPSSNFASWDTRGAITPHPILRFDDTSSEDAFFTMVMPRNYSGGSLIVTVVWAAASATSGAVVWQVSFELLGPNGTNLGTANYGTATTATASPTAVNGRLTYTAITALAATVGAAVGQTFRMKLARLPANPSDTMVGDAEFASAEIREA